jgi:translation initiation factor IF-2
VAVPAKKAAAKNSIEIPVSITVRDLSELMDLPSVSVIKQLMRGGIMANINQVLDFQIAGKLAASLGFEIRKMPVAKKGASKRVKIDASASGLKKRPPVVTIMGHVDHGKTRLLDVIRKTNVMDSEAGGITQHIGAYQIEIDGHKITFLDTPGHEAFTSMRARGAQITDITVLVVAADDGVMPQTREAIDHARAAGVPIIVAINKIDKDNANPDLVKQQLADAGLLIEDWGGDVIAIPTSAKSNIGIDLLLENIMLMAEMENLQSDPSRMTAGVVIESRMDKNRGAMATVLVQSGMLRVGQIAVIGTTWGKIKAMYNYTGKQVRKAGPSTPTQILGLSAVPQVGDILKTVASEHQARNIIGKRETAIAEHKRAARMSGILDQLNAGNIKELNIILKADVQGSIEPIKASLEQLSSDEVKIMIIHSGVGNVTESDVMLASASHGLIIGFNVNSETGADRQADIENIDIRQYNIIYEVIDDVSKAMKGMLEPVYIDVVEGIAEVRNVFSTGKKGKAGGVYVKEGKLNRNASVRVRRSKEIVTETTVASIKRFKDDANDVAAGYECGVGLNDFNDYEIGDILEFYRKEIKR